MSVTAKTWSALVASLLVAVIVFGMSARELIIPYFFAPTPQAPTTVVGTNLPEADTRAVTTLMSDLHVPWETVVTPDGELLVTERNGTLRLRRLDGSETTFQVEGVVEVGEGGLLGMALAPDFASTARVYLYVTSKDGDGYVNRVVRYTMGDALTERTVIVDGIPAAKYHNGGRIAFGPDGMLYVTTGDGSQTANAQNKDSLGGKVLRVKPDGSIPSDNPFGNATWSYGHRNAQGIVWDDKGRLWATEHGRSGAATGFDELNLIVKGGNYGWPVIQGDETRDGMITPVRHSGSKEAWAPAGIAFANGSLYFTGLRGTSLYEARVDEKGVVTKFQAHFRGDFGRLRGVVLSGQFLLVTTSNRDGRGTPHDGDDKVLRVRVNSLVRP